MWVRLGWPVPPCRINLEHIPPMSYLYIMKIKIKYIMKKLIKTLKQYHITMRYLYPWYLMDMDQCYSGTAGTLDVKPLPFWLFILLYRVDDYGCYEHFSNRLVPQWARNLWCRMFGHSWEHWDEGDAENGPMVYVGCRICHKTEGPHHM